MPIPAFDLGVLQSICDILGDTGHGFTGAEIGRFLRECNIDDPLPQMTKKYRLFEALKIKQTADRCGNNVVAFIQHTMNPARHHGARDWFEDCRSNLNGVLIFAGYSLHEDGKLREVEKAETLSEAAARASSLRTHLVIRKVHPDVLRYCREELLVDNYFHAVFEATKSVADKIRGLSGLTSMAPVS